MEGGRRWKGKGVYAGIQWIESADVCMDRMGLCAVRCVGRHVWVCVNGRNGAEIVPFMCDVQGW